MSAPGADPLAAIRKRFNTPTVESRLQMLCDISDLLTQWDIHQSALRALVAQWRKDAQEKRYEADYAETDHLSAILLRHADAIDSCADALERLLSGSQP